MSSKSREKLTTRVDARILAHVRNLARSEGRQWQALVDEALADLIGKRQQADPRPQVMGACQASHAAFGSLHEQLAKAEDIIDRCGQTRDMPAK